MKFSYSFPLWIAAFALIIAAVIITISYRRTDKPLSRRMGAVLTGLRIASVGLVLICLIEPTILTKEETYRKSNLLLLMDDSQSMSMTDAGDNLARIEAVKKAFKEDGNGPIKALEDKFNVQTYLFSSDSTRVTKASDPDLTAQGALTDIGKAILKAADEWRGQSNSGIILVTDGGNNSGENPLEIAGQIGVPIYTIGVGSSLMPRDIQVSRVEASPIAYINHVLPVKAVIKSSGYDGRQIQVSLVETQNSQILDSVPLTLDSKISEQTVDLQIKPQQEGTFSFSVTVPEAPDEFTTRNNAHPFFIKVVKTKLRILYADGRPRWEYAFLKRALQKDPNIEPKYLVAKRKGAAFSEFPSNRKDLFSYDVLILGDINPSLFSVEQLNIIRDFIEDKGGSIIFLGGKQSLGRGGFGESHLREMLPVEIGTGGARQVVGAFNPVLTQEGLRHPLTRLGDDQTENAAIWRDLPALTHFYAGSGVKLGATVLAEHQREPGQPVIVFQRYGNGTVLMINTDSTWRWAFGAYPFGGDDSQYRKFWSGAIRWITSARTEAELVRVETDKGSYYSGEKVRFTVYVYDESFAPVDNAQLKAQIQLPSETGAQPSILPFSAFTADGNGRYSAEFNPPKDGHYKVQVEAFRADRLLGKGSAEFIVQLTMLEFQDTQLKEAFLKELADISGGAYYHLNDISSLPASIKEVSSQPYTFIRERGIWDNGVMLFIVVALLGAEWLLRKQKGLV